MHLDHHDPHGAHAYVVTHENTLDDHWPHGGHDYTHDADGGDDYAHGDDDMDVDRVLMVMCQQLFNNEDKQVLTRLLFC